jgi:hypothetical protein
MHRAPYVLCFDVLSLRHCSQAAPRACKQLAAEGPGQAPMHIKKTSYTDRSGVGGAAGFAAARPLSRRDETLAPRAFRG